jgi:hypothetical protein
LIVNGKAVVVVDAVTVHRTRSEAPPPLPEPLHWVTVALVVLLRGLHNVVGSAPPPVPESMHWLTVAVAVVPAPVMVLTTSTEHRTVLPPPLPDPLHCVTEEASTSRGLLVQSGAAFGAPWQAVIVLVELLVCVTRLSRLLITTVQSISRPPPLYTPLHWLTEAPAADAPGASPANRPNTKIITATTVKTGRSRRRRGPVAISATVTVSALGRVGTTGGAFTKRPFAKYATAPGGTITTRNPA